MSLEIEHIKQKILPILRKHNVTKAGIFGSYARGEQKKKSDIDLLIEIDPNLDLFDIIRLKLILEKEVNKKVDLVEYSCIRPELKERILGDEIPLEL